MCPTSTSILVSSHRPVLSASLWWRKEQFNRIAHDANTIFKAIRVEAYHFHGHPALQIGVQSSNRART